MNCINFKQTRLRVVRGDIARIGVDAVVIPERDAAASGTRAKHMIAVEVATSAGKTSEKILRRACRQAFAKADQRKAWSLAIPALGAGVGGFPAIGSAKILAQETLKYLRVQPTALREIIFCLPDLQSQQIFEKNLIGYIRHVEEVLGQGPYVTVDCVIELPQGIVVIERSNPPYGWALPGGFVDYGESLEAAIRREVREETGLRLVDFEQVHVYSDPRRDPRFHTVTVLFVGKGKGKPKAGDDAQGLKIVPYSKLLKGRYAFDHKKMIGDYLKKVTRSKSHKVKRSKSHKAKEMR